MRFYRTFTFQCIKCRVKLPVDRARPSQARKVAVNMGWKRVGKAWFCSTCKLEGGSK